MQSFLNLFDFIGLSSGFLLGNLQQEHFSQLNMATVTNGSTSFKIRLDSVFFLCVFSSNVCGLCFYRFSDAASRFRSCGSSEGCWGHGPISLTHTHAHTHILVLVSRVHQSWSPLQMPNKEQNLHSNCNIQPKAPQTFKPNGLIKKIVCSTFIDVPFSYWKHALLYTCIST